MKIIFFGTPEFSAILLEYLAKHHLPIIGIVTQPDRPKGRFQNLSFSQVKEVAQRLLPDVPIFQPVKASDPEFIERLDLLKPDLFVVVSYGQILRKALLDVPVLGSINVHVSLLPKYRGAAPIQRCLMAGEKKTGITIMKLAAELDAGDILDTAEVSISENMTAGELTEKLLEAAKPLLLKVLKALELGPIAGMPQDHTKATYAKKLLPNEFQIAWDFPAETIHNLIRALSPKPGAFAFLTIDGEKKRLKIIHSRVSREKGEAPGQILKSSGQLIVACQDHSLELLEVQLEGKRAMPIQEFLKGIRSKFLF